MKEQVALIIFWQKKHSFGIAYNLGQNIWNKMEKSSKSGQEKKSLVSVLTCFLTAIAKIYLVAGRLGATLCVHPILRFFFYFLFPKNLSLKSFGNSWNNSYTKFAMLDIKFRFTCGESNLCQHNLKFQNIMTKIVVFMLLTLKVATTTSSPAHILAIRRRRIFLNSFGDEVFDTMILI